MNCGYTWRCLILYTLNIRSDYTYHSLRGKIFHILIRRRNFTMNADSKKKIAYDLTLEYVKQNNIMKVNMDSTIPKSINTVEKIYNEIYASLEGKNIL